MGREQGEDQDKLQSAFRFSTSFYVSIVLHPSSLCLLTPSPLFLPRGGRSTQTTTLTSIQHTWRTPSIDSRSSSFHLSVFMAQWSARQGGPRSPSPPLPTSSSWPGHSRTPRPTLQTQEVGSTPTGFHHCLCPFFGRSNSQLAPFSTQLPTVHRQMQNASQGRDLRCLGLLSRCLPANSFAVVIVQVMAVESEFKGVLQSNDCRALQLFCHTVRSLSISHGGIVQRETKGRGRRPLNGEALDKGGRGCMQRVLGEGGQGFPGLEWLRPCGHDPTCRRSQTTCTGNSLGETRRAFGTTLMRRALTCGLNSSTTTSEWETGVVAVVPRPKSQLEREGT